jgi:hypothetical protein
MSLCTKQSRHVNEFNAHGKDVGAAPRVICQEGRPTVYAFLLFCSQNRLLVPCVYVQPTYATLRTFRGRFQFRKSEQNTAGGDDVFPVIKGQERTKLRFICALRD